MQKSAKYALIACVLVLVLGGAGFWYFVLRDDAPDKANLEALTGPGASQQQTDGSGGGEVTPDGEWVLVTGDNVFAGYRIQELFGGDTIKKTAAGRTPAVTGSMTIDGTQVTVVEVVADLEQLRSDESRRDESQRGGGLQINQFPTATFRLTEPVQLGSVPEQGTPVEFVAKGELTLHGVTRPVELPLEAQWDGASIVVAGGAPIVLADYDIDPPRTTFVNVDDVGEFEVQLRFERG
jgi:polyisoprenoid-binding protein YceI